MVEQADDAVFWRAVMRSEKPVVVYVSASWCGPCKQQTPMFEAAAARDDKAAVFLKIDADSNEGLLAEFKIMAIPTLLFFSHGRLVERKSGVLTDAAICSKLEPLRGYTSQDAERMELKGWFRNLFRKKRDARNRQSSGSGEDIASKT